VTLHGDMVEVRLLGIPLELLEETMKHYDALFREFQLIAAASSEPSSVPTRLTELVTKATARYSGFTAGREEHVEAARAAGRENLDLTFELPASVGDVAVELGDLLEEAEEFCRSGDLLTLVAPPSVRGFRDWYLEEIVRQVGGGRPTPYAAWLDQKLTG
jgi:hypothetical protein